MKQVQLQLLPTDCCLVSTAWDRFSEQDSESKKECGEDLAQASSQGQTE